MPKSTGSRRSRGLYRRHLVSTVKAVIAEPPVAFWPFSQESLIEQHSETIVYTWTKNLIKKYTLHRTKLKMNSLFFLLQWRYVKRSHAFTTWTNTDKDIAETVTQRKCPPHARDTRKIKWSSARFNTAYFYKIKIEILRRLHNTNSQQRHSQIYTAMLQTLQQLLMNIHSSVFSATLASPFSSPLSLCAFSSSRLPSSFSSRPLSRDVSLPLDLALDLAPPRSELPPALTFDFSRWLRLLFSLRCESDLSLDEPLPDLSCQVKIVTRHRTQCACC